MARTEIGVDDTGVDLKGLHRIGCVARTLVLRMNGMHGHNTA